MELLDMEHLEKHLPKGKKGKMLFLAAAGGVAVFALYLSSKKQETDLYTPDAQGGYPEAGAAAQGDTSAAEENANSLDAIYNLFDDLYTRQEAQMEAQADYMDKVVTKVQNSDYKVSDIEDTISPLMQEREKRQNDIEQMAQNSDAWFHASPAERTQLEKENAEIAAKYGLTKNPSSGSWTDASGAVAYVTTKQQTEASTATIAKTTNTNAGTQGAKVVSTSNVDAQMKANSDAWHKASTQAEKDRLHAENVKLASAVGAGKTYNSKTGVWA